MDRILAMQAFVTIVDSGSLSAAADVLDTSLPTVVRTLAALERNLGVRLLNRTTRRLSLTDEGKLYLDRARQILAAVVDAEQELAARQGVARGRLAITAPVSFGRRFVSPFVMGFIERHGQVAVELLLVDRLVEMLEEGIDIAVRIGHLDNSSLIAVPVGSVRRVACASPAYLARHGTPATPQALAEHRSVTFTSLVQGSYWTFGAGRRAVNVPVRSVFTSNQVDACVDACVKGAGIGMFLSYQVAPLIAQGALTHVLKTHEPPEIPVCLVYQQRRPTTAAMRYFVDEAVAALRAGDYG